MTSKTTNKLSAEMRGRAVRLVLDREGYYTSRWVTCQAISAKIGCSAHTLLDWGKMLMSTAASVPVFPPMSPRS